MLAVGTFAAALVCSIVQKANTYRSCRNRIHRDDRGEFL